MNDVEETHNVFRSDDLWKQSTLFEDIETYQSSLFTPLLLDSRLSSRFHSERANHTHNRSPLNQI